MKRLTRRQLVVGVLCLAALCILAGLALVSTNQKSILIITGAEGGLCAQGPCGGDDSVVYSDGTYTNHQSVSTQDMNRLKQLIDNFNPSTYDVNGDCGSSTFDGSDPYVKFPQKTGDRQFESCGIVYNAKNPQPNPLKEIFTILNAYKKLT